MPKQIETSFVINGSISPDFLSAVQGASDKFQTLTDRITAIGDDKKLIQQFDLWRRKLLNTSQTLSEMTVGTKEWERTRAAVDRYSSTYGNLHNAMVQAGIDTQDLAGEQKRLNAELQNSKILTDGMKQAFAAEAVEVRRLAQEYANASQQLAQMNAQEQARVNGTYQAYKSTAQANGVYDIYGTSDAIYSENTVAGSIARASIQKAQQDAAAAEAMRAQQDAIRKAQQQSRFNTTSFLGGLGGFSFMGLGMSALGHAAPYYLAGAAVRGAYDLAKASVTESMNFNQIVSELKAYTHATDAQTAALRDVAIEIGINSVFTSAEAARAMTYLGKAGWTTGQIQSGIVGVMNLAAASGEDLASVASIVADSLGAFGMKAGEAQRFADVLAKTATRSNTDVGLIGETFKTSAPVAGALGYRIEDVAQMVGILANVGIKGTRAGTTSRNILNAIAKGFTISGAKLGDYVFSATDEYGNQKSLRDTIDELRRAFSKLSNIEQVQNAQAIASMRGYAGLLALVNADAEAYDRLAEEIADADGAAEEMAKTRLDNLAGDVQLLSDAFGALKIKIGDIFTPELRGSVQVLTSILRLANGEEADLGDEGKDFLKTRGKDLLYYAATGTLGLPLKWLNDLYLKTFDVTQEWLYGKNYHFENNDDVIDETVTANEDLEESYENVLEAAKDSLEGQFKLWEQASETIPKDIYELMDAQESQAAYWKEYTANLDALYLRAGSIPGLAEFVNNNATGTADSVALMAGLMEATDAELTEFMRLYQENEYNRNNAAEAQSVTLNFYMNDAGDKEVADEIASRVEDALRRIQEDRARIQIA